jgi:hypothetical protein
MKVHPETLNNGFRKAIEQRLFLARPFQVIHVEPKFSMLQKVAA